MVHLVNLLLRERWRKSQAQYGWLARVSICCLLLLIAAGSAPVISRTVEFASPEEIGLEFSRIFAGWVIMGVLLSKDLTWRLRLDRLMVYHISFGRLYGMSLVLAFFSFPLLLLLCVIELCF